MGDTRGSEGTGRWHLEVERDRSNEHGSLPREEEMRWARSFWLARTLAPWNCRDEYDPIEGELANYLRRVGTFFFAAAEIASFCPRMAETKRHQCHFIDNYLGTLQGLGRSGPAGGVASIAGSNDDLAGLWSSLKTLHSQQIDRIACRPCTSLYKLICMTVMLRKSRFYGCEATVCILNNAFQGHC